MEPKRKSLSPPQKKALSYQKDRRNTYGERGANSRFAIENSKTLIRQALRSAENQTLRQVTSAQADEEVVDEIENAFKALPQRKRRFDKSPDTPLGTVVNNKLKRRQRQDAPVRPDVSSSMVPDPLAQDR